MAAPNSTDAEMQAEMAAFATYEELATLEAQFNDVDTQIMARQFILSKPLFARRKALIAKVINFWPIALEQVPESIDQFILPSDSELLNDCLKDITLERFETPETFPSNSDNVDDFGEPRSFRITFHFAMNDWFTNESLTKTFWYRRRTEDVKASVDSFAGLVSEPVKIDWKKGKDLSEGLTDMTVALFEARKKTGDFMAKGLPEYTALKKKVETANGMNTSFFTWYGFVSNRRYVSAEESAKANEEFATKKAELGAAKAGAEQLEQDDGTEADADDDTEVEVHEAGEELAIALADDLWPGAIRYFTEAQEMDVMSELDFEEMEDDSDDGEPIDIRALVQEKGGKGAGRKASGSGAPPSKKQKK